MDEITNPTTIWGAIGGALTAGVAGIFWVRKTLASTAAGVAGDRAEVNMIDVLQTENAALRQRIDTAERERNEQFQQLVSLQADMKIIQASQDLLVKQISDLTQTNQQLTQKIAELSSALEQHHD